MNIPPGQGVNYTEATIEVSHKVVGVSPPHGHTFVIRIYCTAPIVPEFGWGTNLYDIKKGLKKHVLERIHPGDENGDGIGEGDLSEIAEIGNASIENITRWIWNQMAPHHPEMVRVELSRGYQGSQEGYYYDGPDA